MNEENSKRTIVGMICNNARKKNENVRETRVYFVTMLVHRVIKMNNENSREKRE